MTWQWQGFHNPARGDKFVLHHWVKCYKDTSGRIRKADDGEYPFAKFNKKVQLASSSARTLPRWGLGCQNIPAR